NTWCVETLQDAIRLQAEHGRQSAGLRFVTRAGEILEADGRLLAGPRQAALGIVSRRSELRSLQHEIVELDPLMRQTDAKIADLRQQIANSEHQVDDLTRDYDSAASQLMNARLAARSCVDRLSAVENQLSTLGEEESALAQRAQDLSAQREQNEFKLSQVAAGVEQLEASLETFRAEMQAFEDRRQLELALLTEIKVESAKSEQRLDGFRGQQERLAEDQRERERAIDETLVQLTDARARALQSERTILASTSVLAELYLRHESLQRQSLDLRQAEQTWQQERRSRQQQLQKLIKQQQEVDQRRHQFELEANRIRLEREALVQRVRDDYDIDLSLVGAQRVEDEAELAEREEVDREINDLRRRLSNMGAVNMAALEEIESLETRHQSLATQYQDLIDAKDSLARIIHKINADSRRVFTETLETIRTNFQALFRRVFGGGTADIVLEEGVDILEAGIDIVATPPGKQSLGISLLSGGERALTAVTLLLAIFQYRPSPFCVLDEVDGPLDEANIGRFVDVLTEFLTWTKFVVVTHSKKTMTAAHTLYGVTMQESGVSKRVSVQFEDVSEDGHIREEAIRRDIGGAADDELGAA
ncbi:MAG: hypothetical protein KDB23_27795, partial [Planctomycetales bacterium]|nr:hypothetical protein [Planctomycetales bacterium]